MTDAQSIADGLTEAQRKCFERSTVKGCCPTRFQTGRALVDKGVARRTIQSRLTYRVLDWTPLGLEVRKIITGE